MFDFIVERVLPFSFKSNFVPDNLKQNDEDVLTIYEQGEKRSETGTTKVAQIAINHSKTFRMIRDKKRFSLKKMVSHSLSF